MTNCKKYKRWLDASDGDFCLDIPRLSHHATQRAKERKIPVAELLKPRSHINGFVNKVVSKHGVVITVYLRSPYVAPNHELPENGRRFTFPKNGIGWFIGKQGVNINRIQAEYHLKSLSFDKNNDLIVVAPTSDYDWTSVEKLIEEACKRKYKSPQQLLAEKTAEEVNFVPACPSKSNAKVLSE